MNMKMTYVFGAAGLLAIASLGIGLAQAPAGGGEKKAATPGLTLTSSDFEDGGIIPNRFTQADPNAVSPKLDWTNVPEGTVSFTLIFHDPDAALQKKTDDVLHWMIFNIPGTAKGLPQGVQKVATMPDGTVQGKNRAGNVGYMGPGAPAQGPYHHYTFELFALDTKLDLKEDATRADVLKALDGHILGKGVLEGRFHR